MAFEVVHSTDIFKRGNMRTESNIKRITSKVELTINTGGAGASRESTAERERERKGSERGAEKSGERERRRSGGGGGQPGP